ncbi:hypothetical protein CHS0354_005604 [Potamilus streckersoni]|uniref:Uncharacterized protein n=1 Tax=Potamilus streckersoni TaxID=2493646 RepID=A0AAE0VXB9_9BIVA|nr:hypothetical protein CHS0354_005604 [Potamilus streckersoni]
MTAQSKIHWPPFTQNSSKWNLVAVPSSVTATVRTMATAFLGIETKTPGQIQLPFPRPVGTSMATIAHLVEHKIHAVRMGDFVPAKARPGVTHLCVHTVRMRDFVLAKARPGVTHLCVHTVRMRDFVPAKARPGVTHLCVHTVRMRDFVPAKARPGVTHLCVHTVRMMDFVPAKAKPGVPHLCSQCKDVDFLSTKARPGVPHVCIHGETLPFFRPEITNTVECTFKNQLTSN